MIINIKDIKIITLKNRDKYKFIKNYICDIIKNDNIKTVELRPNQLTQLYRNYNNIEFNVSIEDMDDLEIIEYSYDKINDDEYDVYKHIYNFCDRIDFENIIANEECFTLNKKDFNKFIKNNSESFYIGR